MEVTYYAMIEVDHWKVKIEKGKPRMEYNILGFLNDMGMQIYQDLKDLSLNREASSWKAATNQLKNVRPEKEDRYFILCTYHRMDIDVL